VLNDVISPHEAKIILLYMYKRLCRKIQELPDLDCGSTRKQRILG